MREYFQKLPTMVKVMIFAALAAVFGYFGINADFSESEPEAPEAISEPAPDLESL